MSLNKLIAEAIEKIPELNKWRVTGSFLSQNYNYAIFESLELYENRLKFYYASDSMRIIYVDSCTNQTFDSSAATLHDAKVLIDRLVYNNLIMKIGWFHEGF